MQVKECQKHSAKIARHLPFSSLFEGVPSQIRREVQRIARSKSLNEGWEAGWSIIAAVSCDYNASVHIDMHTSFQPVQTLLISLDGRSLESTLSRIWYTLAR